MTDLLTDLPDDTIASILRSFSKQLMRHIVKGHLNRPTSSDRVWE